LSDDPIVMLSRGLHLLEITPRQENIPLTINANYLVGYNFTSNWQIRPRARTFAERCVDSKKASMQNWPNDEQKLENPNEKNCDLSSKQRNPNDNAKQ
jgi:hypothetical protein